MNEKKKLRRLPKRILSFVLSLAMVLTLMPGMSMEAYAAEPAGRGESWDILYSEVRAKGSGKAYPVGTRIYMDMKPRLQNNAYDSLYMESYDAAVSQGYVSGTYDSNLKNHFFEQRVKLYSVLTLQKKYECSVGFCENKPVKSGGYWIFKLDEGYGDKFYGVASSGNGGRIPVGDLDFGIDVKPEEHEHTWSYKADGATLKAWCEVDGCTSGHTTEATAVSLTLTASSANYSGSAATITLGGKDAWEAAGLTAPSVAYEDASGNEISSAPTVVGTYYATITVDGKKAKVQYTIEQVHGADTSKYSYDDTNHWNPCLRSDCTDTGHKYNTAAHSYDGTTHKCVCGKIDPSYHVHVLGTKHNAVPGNCVDKGTLEYYDCAGTVGGACGKYLDAEGHELASIEGTTNASNHKGTSTTWTKTATTHKETYDCCGVVKTAEASHTSSGAATEDAAEVCTVCGYEIAAKLPHTHKYATTYSKDATGHWYAATCGHDVKDGFASHTSSGAATEAKAEVCTVCGYEIAPQLTHTHTYATTYSKDATGHWYAATCGHDVQGSFAAHSYGDWTVTKLATATESGEKERTCSICSYKETVATSYDKPASDTDSDAGKIENTTDSSKNDCTANVEITKSEIIEKLDLTPEELSRVENGENISINLEVKAEEPKNIPQAEKKEAEKKLESGEKIGQYLDINLFKVVGNDKSKVSQTKGEIKIEITIPSDIKKAGTDFFIIRVHNGKATKLALTLVSGDTYSFETDQFSTYAIGYKEKSSDSNNDNNNNNNTNDDKKKEDSNTNDSDNKTEVSSPKTGDPKELRGWFFALIASLGGLLVLGGLKRKEKASK